MARKAFGTWFRFSIIALTFTLVLAAIIVLFRGIEPEYEGWSLTKWLDRTEAVYARCSDPEHPELDSEWRECQAAVTAMGKKALPFLIAWTTAEDSDTKIRAIRWLNRHPAFHVEIHPDPAMRKHLLAMHGFNLLGKDAAPVLPDLVRMTSDKNRDRRFWGYVVLASTRPDKQTLVPVVARLLNDSDSEIKRMAAETIFGFYPDEARKLGVCELFPEICSTNGLVHMP